MECNEDTKREIKSLLEKLTHSGKETLNVDQVKRIKIICSLSKAHLEFIYKEIVKLLEKKHSEVRFSTVQLCDELLLNIADFRDLFLDNIRTFLKYTFEEPLPPPKSAANKLLKLTITCFDNWNTKFGNSVYKLNAAYKYLKKRKHVDFEIKEIIDPKKRMEEKEKEHKTLLLNKEHLKKITSEMEEMKYEIDSTIASLETCFSLLLPSPDEFNTDDLKKPNEVESSDFEMRLFGVLDPEHTVQIEFDGKIEIKENEENSIILSTAKESFALIKNRFLPKTKAWIELICKVNDKSDSGILMEKKAVDQENKLNQMITKYNTLKIVPISDQIEDISSDSDLEEVVLPKPDKVTRQREEIGFLSESLGLKEKSEIKSNTKEVPETDITKTNDKERKHNEKMSERKKELLKIAPKLPFDIDLYHWEDEKLPVPTMLPVTCEGARFWSAGTSEEINELPIPGGSSALRTRVIEFSGEFVPIERACRVPLPSGKLCPRKDRVKCPFHGIIVDRDDKGNIVNEEDKQKVASMPVKPAVPEWQDPKLLAEIKAATGVDLKMPVKGERKKKVKHPGLTDLNAAKKTAKARLSKKIFNKASVKRVAAVMNSLDHKKHRDKFGDQFNYVHDTS